MSEKLNLDKYRVSQKKVWLAASDAKLYFFVQLSCILFFQYFLEFSFFLVLQLPKKSAKLFPLSKSKVQKSKILYTFSFYQILKFCKYWIKESQKIRKIVIWKFAIFSFGLILKERLFFNSSSVFYWTAYINKIRIY